MGFAGGGFLMKWRDLGVFVFMGGMIPRYCFREYIHEYSTSVLTPNSKSFLDMKTILLLLLLPCLSCFGSNVIWDSFTLQKGGVTGTGLNAHCSYCLESRVSDGDPYGKYDMYSMLCFDVQRSGSRQSSMTAVNLLVLEYGDNWIQTYENAVVDVLNTVKTDSCFFHGWVSGIDDITGTSDYSIDVHGTETIYLGLATFNEMGVGKGETYYNYALCYGWVELQVSGVDVTLVHSCINLDGDPIIVGTDRSPAPIPEPSTGLLGGLGTLLLFRRRKK